MLAAVHVNWGALSNYIQVIVPVGGFAIWLTRKVMHELKPNSGNSLRDAVDRIEADIAEVKEWNKLHDAYHNGLNDGK